jgi:serine/threonine protein kinase/ankyrin repeat protein
MVFKAPKVAPVTCLRFLTFPELPMFIGHENHTHHLGRNNRIAALNIQLRNWAFYNDWRDLNIDENYVDFDTSWGKFLQIENVIGRSTDCARLNYSPKDSWTFLHWAAYLNYTWLLSQFLLDTEHVDVMALDSEGKTALDIALANGSKQAAAMLQADPRVTKAVAEQEKLRRAAEEEKLRIAAEQEKQRIAAEKEKQRIATEQEKQQRIAAEKEKQRIAAEEEKQRIASEQEKQCIAAEKEKQRIAAEQEKQRIAAEQEKQRIAAEQEKQRIAAEQEKQRIAAEQERLRIAAEREKQRIAIEEHNRLLREQINGAASANAPPSSSSPREIGFYAPKSRLIYPDDLSKKLAIGIGQSKKWNDLDIDENYVSLDVSKAKLKELNIVVDAASQGKRRIYKSGDFANPIDAPVEATLLHWAANYNQCWVISQYLADEHVEVLALDSFSKTPYEVALIYGNEQAVSILLADRRVAEWGALPENQGAIAQIVSERATELAYKAERARVAAKINTLRTAPWIDLLHACNPEQRDHEIAKKVLFDRSYEFGALKKLEIVHTQFSKIEIGFLLAMLFQNPQMRNLNGQYYQITSTSRIKPLLLEEIIISHCALDFEGLVSLLPLFQACGHSLQKLDLAGNKLSDESAFWFSKILFPEFKKLFSLNVSENPFENSGIQVLKDLCRTERVRLTISKITAPSAVISNLSHHDLKSGLAPVASPQNQISSSGSKQTLDSQGGLRVQFTILYEELTINSSKVLGSGAFGIVYRGEYNFTHVAIKCLHANKLSEKTLEEFKKESLLMGQMRHPNIVQTFGACFEPGHYSLVMELMPKGSLHDLLHNTQTIPWTLRWQIAVDVSAGLAYLHDQKIIHRDLKSMNVLWNGSHAKISDFGLATVKIETQSTTQAGSKAAGTTRWMAPELFKRNGKCSTATDVYSLGMVFWELASREIPYKDGNEIQAMGWIKDGEKENIPDDCPLEMKAVILDCWKAPSERQTSENIHQTLLTLFGLFNAETQAKTGVSTRTELRAGLKKLEEGQEAIQQKQEKIAEGMELALKLQLPPIPSYEISAMSPPPEQDIRETQSRKSGHSSQESSRTFSQRGTSSHYKKCRFFNGLPNSCRNGEHCLYEHDSSESKKYFR